MEYQKIQLHPEFIATAQGMRIFLNFIEVCLADNQGDSTNWFHRRTAAAD
jgi:GMP synthase-like glutamine amidotransferase